jgi:hypothetical protein
MPPARRLATLAAFVHCLEATAQDDVLEVLEILFHELFGDAEKADKKSRLRTLKDLDGAAATLADVRRVLLDPASERCASGGSQKRVAALCLSKRQQRRYPRLHLLRARSVGHCLAPA